MTSNETDEIESALTTIFVRRALGETDEPDVGRAHRLIERLIDAATDPEPMHACLIAGFLAAWIVPESADLSVVPEAIESARFIVDQASRKLMGAGTGEARAERAAVRRSGTLAAACLALVATKRWSASWRDDLLYAAGAALRFEHPRLCEWAAREALASRDELDPSHAAFALLILGVAVGEHEAVAEGLALARDLPLEDATRGFAEAWWPGLVDEPTPAELVGLADSLVSDDRAAAAEQLLAYIQNGRTEDYPWSPGLIALGRACAQEPVNVALAREGFGKLIETFRGLRLTGELPVTTTRAIESGIDLLLLPPTPATAELIVEVTEALADAGLSDIVIGEAVDAGVDASILRQTAIALGSTQLKWPSAPHLYRMLRSTDVLFVYARHRLGLEPHAVLLVYLSTQGIAAVKKIELSRQATRTLDRLATQRVGEVEAVSQAALDTLVGELLPTTLTVALASGAHTGLMIVPSGPLWAIPWAASSALKHVQLTTCASVSLWSHLRAAESRVESIVAVIDDAIPGADVVKNALASCAAAGLRVTFTGRLHGLHRHGSNLAVIFCHGGGEGIEYRLALPQESRSAAELVAGAAPRMILAACGSGGLPPAAYPLSVPTWFLLGGASTVAAGLWPLPSEPTAEVVAHALRALPKGGGICSGLRQGIARSSGPLAARGGLSIFGRDDGTGQDMAERFRPDRSQR